MSVLIIAEAGVNYNGSLDLAREMARTAKDAGADIVKFQTGVPEQVISRYAEKASYQKETTGNEESQLEMVRKLLLPFRDFPVLKGYCEQIGIGFLSTPFDTESIAFLETLSPPFWKIPSGEVTNLPYLLEIAKTRRPVVMSTGMCELDEIAAAIRVLEENGTPPGEDGRAQITLLHCNTEYPTPYEDANLRAMITLRERF